MGPHENTIGKSPGQLQSPELPGSASQAEEPGSMQAESPRQCSICEGPNHYGCGCEAKARTEGTGFGAPAAGQRRTVGMVETEAPVAKVDDDLESILSPEGIIEEHEAFKKMAKDIKTMADGFEGLCACFYDTNQYLKIIAGDLITIRKILTNEYKESETKKTEPENAAENKN